MEDNILLTMISCGAKLFFGGSKDVFDESNIVYSQLNSKCLPRVSVVNLKLILCMLPKLLPNEVGFTRTKDHG